MAGFLLAVLVIGYALVRGQDIKRVSPTGEVEFYSTGGGAEFSSEEIKQEQQGFDRRLTELEQRARQAATADPAPPEADQVPALGGSWFGGNGLRYQIEQFGTEAVIREISAYGITAVGYGEVDSDGATFNFEAIDGSTGVADLELIDDRTLRGTFNNDSYGTSMPAQLTR